VSRITAALSMRTQAAKDPRRPAAGNEMVTCVTAHNQITSGDHRGDREGVEGYVHDERLTATPTQEHRAASCVV
jgi:hypothetical protein